MRKGLAVLGCGVLVLSACATPTTTTIILPGTSTTSTTAPTTTAPPETTTTTSVPITVVPGSTLEILDDGRPSTFLAVTDDFEAVEVDTLTGQVVRSFGSRASAAEVAAGIEIAPNAVDAIWRVKSGAVILVSECCEPAAGRINYLGEGQQLSPSYTSPAVDAWAAVPSPTTDDVILVGFFTNVTSPLAGAADPDRVTFLQNDGSGVSAIGWNADGERIHWYDPTASELVTWDTDDPVRQFTRTPLSWIEENQGLVGLDGQDTGNVVSFIHTYGPDFEITFTEGVVYSPETGEVAGKFDVPAGSVFGGYESTGDYFIYTTPDGTVAFQGRGRLETLGTGFVFASW